MREATDRNKFVVFKKRLAFDLLTSEIEVVGARNKSRDGIFFPPLNAMFKMIQ